MRLIDIDLIKALEMLMPGEQVTLSDITRKLGIPETTVQQEILAALAANPAFGSYNTFTSTFTRGMPTMKKRRRRWWLIPPIVTIVMMTIVLVVPLLFGK